MAIDEMGGTGETSAADPAVASDATAASAPTTAATKPRAHWFVFFGLALTVLVLDQLTKAWLFILQEQLRHGAAKKLFNRISQRPTHVAGRLFVGSKQVALNHVQTEWRPRVQLLNALHRSFQITNRPQRHA